MKTAAWSVLFLLATSAMPVAQGQSDRDAITAALEHWNRGFALGDAVLAARDYAESGVWTNVAGVRAIGPAAISRALAGGFSRGNAHEIDYDSSATQLEFLSETVALLRTRTFQEGSNRMVGINQLRVFVKRDGTWLIVSHLLSAERAR